MSTTRLKNALACADLLYSSAGLESTLSSFSADERLHAIVSLRVSLENGSLSPSEDVVELLGRHLSDPDSDCRWQAAIAAANCLDEYPAAVWQLIQTHGVSGDDDVRALVACVLLEHYLDVDPQGDRRSRADQLAATSTNFQQTLAMVW